ncbi:MAG: NAD(P)-binding domain-containing protein [Bacteroidetes bacterium]|nr:NAD(P)-binding domain-containing protein [Bacteroidota bacterium]
MRIIAIDSVHPVLYEELRKHGHVVDELTHLSGEELLSVLPQYEGFIIRSKFKITKEIIDACPKLKFIARSGSGMENIDLTYAKSKGIECFNSPEGNRDAVAEQVLGMLLMLLNKLKIADTEVRNGIWKRAENRGIELKGKTFAIIGYGQMGSAVAQRLQGFEMKVLAYDKYKTTYNYQSSMEEIWDQADFVSLHLPLTEETRNIVNEEWLNKFKKNIFLINTARGQCVKTSDLVAALKHGKVRGACLDVLEYEAVSFENLNSKDLPEDFQYLIKSDKVILSPHIAGWTHESYEKLSTFLAKKIIDRFSL